MITRVYSAQLHGLTSTLIEVELDTLRGLPGFTIIGLPSKAVAEAKERVAAALATADIRIRSKKIVVNLAPADLHKTGSTFELAIAVAFLKKYGHIKRATDKTLFFGELSLDGTLKPIRGALALVHNAHQLGFETVVLPLANAAEVASVRNVTIIAISTLQQFITWAREELTIAPLSPVPSQPQPHTTATYDSLYGQLSTKRALAIAAAGHHHLLLQGAPGNGKTMLAHALRELLPPLTDSENSEVAQLYSIAEQSTIGNHQRPFRHPHHSSTLTTLLGGGTHLRPGEIVLAHHGVLFLDELAEFSPRTLNALRQPLEEHSVTLTNGHGTVTYPAACTLIAAMNPCPCGFYGTTSHSCRCTPAQRERYQRRISAALHDRFDLHLWVEESSSQQLLTESATTTTASVINQIKLAQKRQQQRWLSQPSTTNGQVTWQQLKRSGEITTPAQKLLLRAYETYHLSTRSLLKMSRVSRTIADLEQSDSVHPDHVAEALQYRQLEPP